MKNKKNAYCTYEFWEKFYSLELSPDILNDRQKRRLWVNFNDFLEDCILHFDIKKKDVNQDSSGGKALYDLLQARGGANVHFLGKHFPDLMLLCDNDDDLLNSVFLCSLSSEDCANISNNYGIMLLNIEMVFSSEHIYVNNGKSFTQANGLNWSYLENLKNKYPSISYCNSLIIADRYLLADVSEKALNFNLRPILDALLPEKLDNDIVFTICIISQKMGKNQHAKLEKIKNIIRNLRPNLNYGLNIYNSKSLHDRSILTNNILLTSGAGFDVVGENDIPLKFTTTVLVFPFLQTSEENDNCYLEWIDNILREEDKCRKYEEDYWGDEDTHHHLLDYYYEEPELPHSSFSMQELIPESLLASLLG